MSRRSSHALAAALLLAMALAGCAGTRGGEVAAKAPGAPSSGAAPPAPVADSVTIGLWHFDESLGQRCTDAGPFHLDGTAGIDAGADFGRFRGGRTFKRVPQSFVHVRDNSVMDSGRGFTVEAWVLPVSTTQYELSIVAARWNGTPNEQSWVLGIVGQKLDFPAVPQEGPGWFREVVSGIPIGRLVFGLQPELAAGARGFGSNSSLPLGRWTHVAATLDGEVVRLYLDGRLDAQHVVAGGIRASHAPLTFGNTFDPRRLTDFGGDLRLDPGPVETPFYAFDGTLDEIRLSSAPRTRFESTATR